MRSRRWTRSNRRRLKPSRWRALRSATASAVAIGSALAVAIGCAKRPAVVPAEPPSDPVLQLRTEIDALIDQPGHQHGLWGIAIHSLTRNERLYDRHPRTLLIPASTMKLVTVAASAAAVGWDYTFATTMLAAGPVVNGALEGDLVVVGSGDPAIRGRPGEDSLAPWIEALRARGISRITGRIIGDDDRIEEPKPGFAWSWEDLAYTYGAVPGALNLAENIVEIAVSPATAEGLPPIVELPADARDLPLVNRAQTSAPETGERLWPELRPGESAMTLNGTIGMGAPTAIVRVAAGNPTEWFARALRNHILAAGIDVAGPPVDVDDLPYRPDWHDATVVHTHRSPALAEIVKPLIKNSINLYAEAVLRLAAAPEGPRSTDAGLDGVRARLESWGIPKEGVQMVDGSGLSRRDVIAPETLVALLQRFYDETGESPWMRAMAVAGRDGSLENRMKGTPAEGNAIGKTGSMSNVRTLAGYVRTADGEPLAFAILANNFEGPASAVTATIDRVVVRLASFSRVETTER